MAILETQQINKVNNFKKLEFNDRVGFDVSLGLLAPAIIARSCYKSHRRGGHSSTSSTGFRR